MKKFDGPNELTRWLISAGVDLTRWETGSAKSVVDLWKEFEQGETSIQVRPPLRLVEVVQINISRDDKILLEVEQEFINGQRRVRSQPPSDKVKPGEDVYLAAVRCLHEELGISHDQIDFIKSGIKTEEEIIESPSYPGLLTRYTIHVLDAQVKGLPEKSFWRENLATAEGDPVKRHLWAWVQRP